MRKMATGRLTLSTSIPMFNRDGDRRRLGQDGVDTLSNRTSRRKRQETSCDSLQRSPLPADLQPLAQFLVGHVQVTLRCAAPLRRSGSSIAGDQSSVLDVGFLAEREPKPV
jgi:hypothetical protein